MLSLGVLSCLTECTGGHSTEALALVSALNFSRYTPRTYIISDGDNLSSQKARELEERKRVSGVKFTAHTTRLTLCLPH